MSRLSTRPRRERKMRVSVFNASGGIVRHHACKAPERADEWFTHWIYRIDGHAVARVVLHQGNLKFSSFRIYQDRRERPAGDPPPRPAFRIPQGTRITVPNALYRPKDLDAECNEIFFSTGVVVESWPGGLHAIRFDGYQHVVDYTAREAKKFRRL